MIKVETLELLFEYSFFHNVFTAKIIIDFIKCVIAEMKIFKRVYSLTIEIKKKMSIAPKTAIAHLCQKQEQYGSRPLTHSRPWEVHRMHKARVTESEPHP